METIFQKDSIVRSVTLFRKRIKFSQLNRIEKIHKDSEGKQRLTLVNLALGTVMKDVPATEMRIVAPEALERFFHEERKSLQLI